MYIPARPETRAVLEKAARDLGLTFTGVAPPPTGPALKLGPVRIALWDRYGGSSSSGWTRWLLERYGFRFDVIYPQSIDAGGLRGRYDVLILTDGGGITGQAGAARLGIARALIEFNSELRPKLKEFGFLTRDPRRHERKKYGQKGARKRFQFSKR